MKSAIASDSLPPPVGPYSPAVRSGDLLFVSGQIPVDPSSGRLVAGDIGAQTSRVLDNLQLLLQAAGLTLASVVRTTVYLADMNDFEAMNAAYGRFFTEPYPARSTIQAARLPKDARIEIDAIAHF
ncbi:MAG: Rid family detoxifying hydrolase [Vicinamibacterales bacterium]